MMKKQHSNLPRNVAMAYNNYKNKMTGKPKAIQTIKYAIQQFQQSRKQCKPLKTIQIYPHKDQELQDEQLYVIKIEGRKNTYYQRRNLYFYMLVEDDYPTVPPEIIVADIRIPGSMQKYTRFLHLNIDENGHVCMLSNQLNKQYYQHTTIKDMIIELQKMIYNPSAGSSYGSELFNCYNCHSQNIEYYKMLNQQGKMLQQCCGGYSSEDDSQEEQESTI